jgi:hypothetical protein
LYSSFASSFLLCLFPPLWVPFFLALPHSPPYHFPCFSLCLLCGLCCRYPATSSAPTGKLRLLYEANPMSLIMEAAGGKAITGTSRILDIMPVSSFCGAISDCPRHWLLLSPPTRPFSVSTLAFPSFCRPLSTSAAPLSWGAPGMWIEFRLSLQNTLPWLPLVLLESVLALTSREREGCCWKRT